ncbi:NADPH-dependent F420 reductase [Rubrivirga sp.]|uniref:NADPH-dependent F420 reductase n=1 Tax=Rubrivirga sp. TaxID=1885344 RepID=UPI003C77704E
MTIAILGTGRVGSALGTAFAAVGHDIVYGSRDPDRDDVRQLVASTGPGARAVLPAEAVLEAEVVVVATPWEATESVVTGLDLEGRVVLDATNPLSFPDLEVVVGTSAGELVQSWAPGAHVVKAFSSVGADVMADTQFGEVRPVMFVAGNDDEAKQTAMGLATSIGFESHDAGGIERSRALEQMAVLWIAHAMQTGREMAFGVLRR